jgi:hypothetical protein
VIAWRNTEEVDMAATLQSRRHRVADVADVIEFCFR